MITLCNPLYCWSGDFHWQDQSVGHPFSFFQTSAFRWGPLQAGSWNVGQFKAGCHEKVFPGTLAAKHLWLQRQLYVLCRFSRHRRRRTRSFCATWKCFKWKCLNILSPRVALEVSWAESYVFERQPHFAGVIRCTHYNLKKGFYGMVDAKQGIPCISG